MRRRPRIERPEPEIEVVPVASFPRLIPQGFGRHTVDRGFWPSILRRLQLLEHGQGLRVRFCYKPRRETVQPSIARVARQLNMHVRLTMEGYDLYVTKTKKRARVD